MTNSFDFRGVRCFASPSSPRTWNFLPCRADVQRGTDGRPLVTLIDMGASGYLLFTATWAAPREDMQALRREIAARDAATRADTIALAFAPVAGTRCNVLLGDGRGTFQVAASSATSGMPPYDAAFNLFLQGERLGHAKAALRGEPGRLAIEYAAELQVPAHAKAAFEASSGELLAALGTPQPGAQALRQALERAVESGAARVTIDAPDPDASHLANELYDRVLARAAELVPRLMRQGASGDVRVTAALDKDVGKPTSAFADIGTLLAAETMESDTGGQDACD